MAVEQEKMASMLSAFATLADIPPAEMTFFRTLVESRFVPAQHHFVRAGEAAADIGFCVQGLFRLYYTTPDGIEYNKKFCGQHEFVASYSAMLLRQSACFSIQALMAISPKQSAPVYCATKAGIRSFTKALRYQLEAMQGRGSGKKLSPEQLAEQFWRAYSRDKLEVPIGKIRLLVAIGGLASPRWHS